MESSEKDKWNFESFDDLSEKEFTGCDRKDKWNFESFDDLSEKEVAELISHSFSCDYHNCLVTAYEQSTQPLIDFCISKQPEIVPQLSFMEVLRCFFKFYFGKFSQKDGATEILRMFVVVKHLMRLNFVQALIILTGVIGFFGYINFKSEAFGGDLKADKMLESNSAVIINDKLDENNKILNSVNNNIQKFYETSTASQLIGFSHPLAETFGLIVHDTNNQKIGEVNTDVLNGIENRAIVWFRGVNNGKVVDWWKKPTYKTTKVKKDFSNENPVNNEEVIDRLLIGCTSENQLQQDADLDTLCKSFRVILATTYLRRSSEIIYVQTTQSLKDRKDFRGPRINDVDEISISDNEDKVTVPYSNNLDKVENINNEQISVDFSLKNLNVNDASVNCGGKSQILKLSRKGEYDYNFAIPKNNSLCTLKLNMGDESIITEIKPETDLTLGFIHPSQAD